MHGCGILIVLKYYLNIVAFFWITLNEVSIVLFVPQWALIDIEMKVAEEGKHILASEFLIDKLEGHQGREGKDMRV